MKTWIISTALLVPALAHADDQRHRASWQDKIDFCNDMATEVAAGREVVEYCEECGDKAPGLPYVLTAGVRDALHTYVRTAPNRFENLALLSEGCPVNASPPTLTQEVATPDGVLITPSDVPVTRPLERAPAADIEPAPPEPTQQPAIHYSTTIIYAMPWFMALAVACAGLLVGGVFTVMLVGMRRRRPMEPRASKLGAET